MAALNAESVKNGDTLGAANRYRAQTKAVSELRDGVAGVSAGFNEALLASGQYGVETVKTVSKTQALTKAISEQKLTMAGALKNMKNFKEAWREQSALQQASVMQWNTSGSGKNSADLYIPRGLGSELDNARTKFGLINKAIGSVATQTINWGKNTQWAGRQITVGIGVPVAIAAAAMTKLALGADQQLTRIAKVYDTYTDSTMSKDAQAAQKATQLSDVRTQSMATAISMAKQYGASMNDTLSLEADLAAVGKTGKELQDSVAQVTRVSTLGELDHQKALDMTITLMTAYKQSASDLTDTFNYMNALENSTSLSTEDFATAIPKAGGALANLGVDVKQMGVLLVALKAGGVDAAEGANALKSATTRLLKPTADAKAQFQAMNIDLTQLTQQTGGNLFDTLSELSKRMKGFSNLQKQQGIAALFGTYQFNRLNVVLDGLGDALSGVGSDTSQVAKALQVAGAGAASWATTADTEIQTFQQSVSGRFKRAVETIKAEMASLGTPIMNALAPMLEFATKLFKAFNDLPNSVKKWTMILAIGAAVAGPMIMLLGLFGNLAGNVLKFGSTIGNLITRFKVLTPEARAQELLAQRAASAFNTEASAAAQLTIELQRLTQTMEAQHAAAQQAAGILPTPQYGGTRGATGRVTYRNSEGQFISEAEAKRLHEAEQETQRMQANSGSVAKNFGNSVQAVAGFAVAGFAIKDMVDGSNSMMQNMMDVAMIAGSIQFGGLVSAGKSIGTTVKTAFSETNALGGVMNLLKNPMLKLWGPVGILAAGAITAKIIYDHMTDMQRAQDKINASTDQWATILGYVAQSKKITATGDVESSNSKQLDMVAQLTDKNKDLAKALQTAAKAGGDFNQVYNLALREALKVRMTGGTADQAKTAFDVALKASGIQKADIEQLDVRFKTVNLDDPDNLRNQLLSQIQEIMDGLGKKGVGGIEPTGFWGGIQKNLLSGDVTDKGRAAASEMATLFAEGFESASDESSANDLGLAFEKQVNGMFAGDYGNVAKENKALFKRMGISNAEELYVQYQKALAAKAKAAQTGSPISKDMSSLLGIGDAKQLTETYGEFSDVLVNKIADMFQIPDATVNKWKKDGLTLTEIMTHIGVGTMSTTDAYKGYEDQVSRSASSWAKLSDAQKLTLLNTWRLKGGLSQATTWTEGFGKAVVDAAEGTDTLAQSIDAMPDSVDIKLHVFTGDDGAKDATQYLQDAFGGGRDAAMETANTIMQRQIQASQDAIQASGDKYKQQLQDNADAADKAFDKQSKDLDKAQQNESDAFDAAWDAREKDANDYFDNESDRLDDAKDAAKDAADAQTKAIQDQMDALSEQDDLRQKLFDREKERISRLAEMQNSNVDFNTALNSGKLDEAAKIMTSNQSQVQQWGIDDQQSAMDDAAAKRQKDMQSQIDQIEAVRDATVKSLEDQKDALADAKDFRLDQLKQERDAEDKALKERQQATKDELEAAKSAAKDASDAAIAAAEKQTQSKVAHSQTEWEDRQTKLGWELNAIKASTPRTQAEYDAQIAAIEAAYAKYGINLQAEGTQWSTIIGQGLTDSVATAGVNLQNSINWAGVGAYIQDQITKGGGITMDQLVTFMQTGKLPDNPAAGNVSPVLAPAVQPATGADTGFKNIRGRHIGGFAGTQAERMGVPRSAGLYPSEVPVIAKRDEFIVNEKASRKNAGILQAINSGEFDITNIARNGQPWIARHLGGSVTSQTAGAPLGYGALLSSAMQVSMKSAAASMMNSMNGSADGSYDGPTGGNINNVLKVARSMEGTPYIWGGAGPSGADCSGFMSIIENAVLGKQPPYGRRWATASFTGGKEIDGWKRGGTTRDVFRIGVDPGSHTAGTFAGINVESGSGHGAMVGKKALGANSGFKYQYYLPAANNLPQLKTGGSVLYDNTLANLHKGETVLTEPLTKAFQDNILASGNSNEYNVEVNFNGPVNSDIDFKKGVRDAIEETEYRNGRNRKVGSK